MAMSYPSTRPAHGSYEWFAREIGIYLGYPNPNNWNHATEELVDSYINRGLHQFYSPTRGMVGGKTHRWSFLRPVSEITVNAAYSTGTVTVVLGVVTLAGGTFPSWAGNGNAELQVGGVTYDIATRDSDTQVTLTDLTVAAAAGSEYEVFQSAYDLPAGFAGVEGQITYQPGTSLLYPSLTKVSEEKIRRQKQVWDESSFPVEYAIRRKTQSAAAAAVYQLVLWPVPQDSYTLDVKYKLVPGSLSPGEFPACPAEFFECALASMLMIAEMSDDSKKGRVHISRYRELLEGAVETDRMEYGPQLIGRNTDTSDDATYDSLSSYERGGHSTTRSGVSY